MAPKTAQNRLLKEYAKIQANPPPYIVAHPSESNILEWHYILTGPPETPYHNGQYWGTLIFPNDYPFAPPAIRMHTPSGRFQPSTRLCLSISDFHPKSYNPAWEVSTILIGLMSFMTSDEMTTGSVSGTPAERQGYSQRTRWWNSTGGGSTKKTIAGVSGSVNASGFGNIKAGDAGEKFRKEWPELDKENWKWLEEKKIDPRTGKMTVTEGKCAPGMEALRRGSSGGDALDGLGQARDAGRGWLWNNKGWILIALVVAWAVLARVTGDSGSVR